MNEDLQLLSPSQQINAIYFLISQLGYENRIKVERRIIREIRDSAPDIYPNDNDIIKSCNNLLKKLK
jgi:hypothetical protein